MNKELITKTLKNTLLVAIYVFTVSQIMNNGDRLFGDDHMLAPFIFLLLFVLSAAVVGGLTLGPSIMYFLENKKSESVKSAIYSIGWLGLYTVLGILALLIIK